MWNDSIRACADDRDGMAEGKAVKQMWPSGKVGITIEEWANLLLNDNG